MKFFRLHFVLAVSLCFGIAVGQKITSANPDFADTGFGGPGYNVDTPSLQGLLALSDEQWKQLMRITHELEDAVFPLALEGLQKQWELEREFRTEPPDQAAITVISADFERIEGQVASLVAEHRRRARAIFGWDQLIVLGKLEAALELYQAAREAVELNLIAGPELELMNSEPGDPFAEPIVGAVSANSGLAWLLSRKKIPGRAAEAAR